MFSLFSFLFLNLLHCFILFLCKCRVSLQSNTQFSRSVQNERMENISKYFQVAFVNFLVLMGDQISDFLCYHAINVNPKQALCFLLQFCYHRSKTSEVNRRFLFFILFSTLIKEHRARLNICGPRRRKRNIAPYAQTILDQQNLSSV